MRVRKPIRLILLGLTVATVSGALAFFGVLRDFRTTQALMPLPIQPFAADEQGGISTNQLGVNIAANWTVTQALQGERTTITGIFSSGRADGSGFSVDLNASIPDGTPVGTVWSSVDAFCDGAVDYMADNCSYAGGPAPNPPYEPWLSPLTWLEAPTDVLASPDPNDDFLVNIMPNPAIFPWLLRHQVAIGWICIDPWGSAASFPSVLNTVYAGIPWSPGGNSFVAATKLGGAPNIPPSSVCLDSPQSSESVTTVYNNPPIKGDLGLPAGDDGNGLYARWTILQSQGSTSLNKAGDLRKDYKSPPSIPSDTGYVERIIDLQCFWIDDNGCDATHGDYDADDSGYLSEQETWNDPNMPAAYSVIDSDGDCLIDPAYAQPGQPKDTLADGITPNDEPTGVPCPASQYSEYPMGPPLVAPYDTAADSDCDGLMDGIEWAYGSDPNVQDTDNDGAPDFVEMFQFTDATNDDTDGDGLLDQPENNYVAAARTDLQCGNNWDDDGDKKVNDGCAAVNIAETGTQCNDNVDDGEDSPADGKVNDGCPAAGPFPESGTACKETSCPDGNSAAPWDTCDDDSDNFINDGCPAAGPLVPEGDASQGELGEAANKDDNCPGVANSDQLNSDGLGRDNGAKIASIYASNPNADKIGDVCDSDDDNDLAVDGYESAPAQGTDPLRMDTDYDTVMDGAELFALTNPLDNPACKLAYPQTCSRPTWAAVLQTYYRGCYINVPAQGAYPAWNQEYDGLENGVEMDVDGDGSICPGDPDSDNGTGTGTIGRAEVTDKIEAFGYNTGLTQKDTDGDGCEDWVEIHDLNGDRTVDSGDSLLVAQRFARVIAGDDLASELIFDVYKNGIIDSGDSLAVAQNSCMLKVNTGGCPFCPPDQ